MAAAQQSIRSLRGQLSILQGRLVALEAGEDNEARDLVYDFEPDGVAQPASATARRLHGSQRLLLTDLVDRAHLADLRILLEASLGSPQAPERLLRSAWGSHSGSRSRTGPAIGWPGGCVFGPWRTTPS